MLQRRPGPGGADVEPTVALQEVEKRYRRVRALCGVTLEVPPGATGLLGPNGAGKTTLLRVLLGLTRPERGSARVVGFDPALRVQRRELRRRVGYLPESDCLIPGMNGVELVATLGRLTGLARTDAMTRAHEVLDYVGIEEARYRRLEGYSGGMKQRLKLAQALVHDPPLLLLDEPTNGLDPGGRRQMLALVHDLAHGHGKSVLVCSHLLPDVERTCERVVVLDRGRVLAEGEIGELTRHTHGWSRLEVDTGAAELARRLAQDGVAVEVEGAQEMRWLRVRLDGRSGDEVFAAAAACGAVVASLVPVRSSLEDVFLSTLSGGAP